MKNKLIAGLLTLLVILAPFCLLYLSTEHMKYVAIGLISLVGIVITFIIFYSLYLTILDALEGK